MNYQSIKYLNKVFEYGETLNNEDCFFNAIAQVLQKTKLQCECTVNSLRIVCKKFAQKQLKNEQSWLHKVLLKQDEKIEEYVLRIEFSVDDIKKGDQELQIIRGRPEIEGKIICNEYRIEIHIIDIFDKKGIPDVKIISHIENTLPPLKSINKRKNEITNDKTIIYIIQQNESHFKPLFKRKNRNLLELKYEETPTKKLKMSSKIKTGNSNSQNEALNTTNTKNSELKMPDIKFKTNTKDNKIYCDNENLLDNERFDKDIFISNQVNKLSSLAVAQIKMNSNKLKKILVEKKFAKSSEIFSLACKYDLIETLKYLFTENPNYNKINFEDMYIKDSENHNAFYYAIRTGNIELLDTLINKLKNSSQNQKNLQEIENLLSSAYDELQLKNISLLEEMGIYVESKLIDLRFSFDNFITLAESLNKDTSSNEDEMMKNNELSKENVKKEIIERIEMISEGVDILTTEYGDKNINFDQKFLFVAKCIARNIHILKKHLKPTYDRLPWEEIEFCTIAFISSQSTEQEINLIYNSVLDKEKLLDHLNNFTIALKKFKIEDNEINGDVPKMILRPQIIQQVIAFNSQIHCIEFQDLYIDYKHIKNIYSLEKIKYYAEGAVAENEDKNLLYLATERALQITGEYIKNTIESPNMTDDISKILLSTFHKDTKKIIMELRDRLSHVAKNNEYLLEKRETVRQFPLNVKNDLLKLKNAINVVIFQTKIKIIKKVLNDIANSENINEAKKYSSIFKNVPLSFMDLKTVTTTEFENVKLLIDEFKEEIKDQTNYEKELFFKIDNIIKFQKEKRQNIKIRYTEEISHLKDIISAITSAENINVIRMAAKNMAHALETSQQSKYFRKIIELTSDIYNSAQPRLKIPYLERLLFEIFYIGEIKTGIIENIKKLKEELETNTKVDSVQNEINEILLYIKKKSEYLFNALIKRIESYQSLMQLTKSPNEPNALKNSREDFEILLGNVIINEKTKSDLIKFFQNLQWKKVQKGLQTLLKDYYEFTKGVKTYLKEKDLAKMSASLLKLCKNWDISQQNEMDRILTEISNEQNIRIKDNFKKKLEMLKMKYEHFTNMTEIEIIQNYKTNILFEIAHEMLVLDILVYLEEKLKCLNSNKYGTASFLNRCFPTPTGKQLRNHLAHGSALINLLQPNSLTIIICNALKLMEKVPPLIDKNLAITIGQPIIDFSYFKKQYESHLSSIINQREFFTAAETGDILKLKNCLNEGADINARDINKWNVLHYAFKGDRLEVVKLFLNHYLFDAEDVEGRQPLHVAALFGGVQVLKFCIEERLINIATFFNSSKKSLLHFAVQGSTNRKKVFIETLFQCIPSTKLKEFINLHDEFGQTCLHNAAGYVLQYNENSVTLNTARYEQHLDVLKILMENGAEINSKENNDCTPLHTVAYNGTKDMIKILMGSNMVDANHKDKKQLTPLHKAAKNGNNSAVEALIEFIDINCQDNEGCTPLHLAVLYGHKNIVNRLLKIKNIEVNCKSYEGHTPLHFATLNISNEILKILLMKEGIEANIEDNNRCTPLHLAAQFGHKSSVESLLKCNEIDINSENCENLTPLHFAALNGHSEVVKILTDIPEIIPDCRCNMSYTPLHLASQNGHKKVVEILITAKNVDVNCKDKEKFTAIHFAAKTGHNNIVETLTAMVCLDILDVNCKCEEGYTPLHLAVQNGYKEIVDTLLKCKKIEINICNNEKLTSLHLAAYFGHNDIVKVLLIDKDIEVNSRCDGNQTPLHLAAQNGHKDVVLSLLNVSNIHCIDDKYYTPLHFAAQNGHKDIVSIFLRTKGLDINCNTIDNFTPLLLASRNGHADVVEMLLTVKSINVNAQCVQGCSSLYLAIPSGHLDVINMLIKTKKINVNLICNNSSRALDLAITSKYEDIVKILIKVEDIETNYLIKENLSPLQITARYNIVNIAEILLMNKQVDINFVNNIQMTALHFAAHFGHIKIVKTLIKVENINVNYKDASNFTPLHLAAIKGHTNVIDALLSVDGIKVNCMSKNKCTPLHLAAVGGHENAVASLLTANNINVKCRNKGSFTPLHTAAMQGYKNIVNSLLTTNKINVNCKTKNGSTALHLAVFNCHKDVVETLLAAEGIKVNSKNKNGSTPLHLAAAFGHKKIVKMLLKAKNINVNSLDNCKLTPTHAAFRNVRKGMIRILSKSGGKLGTDCKYKKRFNYTKKFINL